jgi:putative tricarboxylic transport membrane protein
MSEATHPAAGQRRRLTTGHHTLDWWAGVSPAVLTAMAFAAATYYETFSGFGLFLRILGVALVVMGLGILALRVHVPNHRDYYGGLALIGLALVAFWAGGDLAGMRGFSFGAGTAPRLFALALAVVASVITVQGLLTEAPPIGKYALRGPLFVCLGVVAFAVLIRGFIFDGMPIRLPFIDVPLMTVPPFRVPAFGLIIASFVTFMISAIASRETRWIETTIMAAAITAFCWLVFVWLLGLPFQLLPQFLLAR